MKVRAWWFRALKGHGFSRAEERPEQATALAAAGKGARSGNIPERHTSGAKAHVDLIAFAARLKPRPFKDAKLAADFIDAKIFSACGLVAVLIGAAGCHSYHVDATVENHTGAPIQLLEVDYPSASFGADKLAAGDVFHYRIQLRGSGPLKVQYTTADERQVQITGPALAERQEGQLQIELLPGGKAGFHPQLTPAR
jgi:hypothetical protein